MNLCLHRATAAIHRPFVKSSNRVSFRPSFCPELSSFHVNFMPSSRHSCDPSAGYVAPQPSFRDDEFESCFCDGWSSRVQLDCCNSPRSSSFLFWNCASICGPGPRRYRWVGGFCCSELDWQESLELLPIAVAVWLARVCAELCGHLVDLDGA